MSLKHLGYIPIKEGDTILFYINTGGFPLDRDTWAHLWTHAEELQPSASQKMQMIQDKKDKLPDVAFPVVPYTFLVNKKNSIKEKLEKIQEYINKLQYNHTGLQFFEIRKDRPIIGLAEVAKKIIDDSLPIKCLEAVILSIYLINEIPTQINIVSKFTIGFKTCSKRNIHRHVVLGVYCHLLGLFGAIGLSRREELGYKELKYTSLSSLIRDYIDSYATYLHKVKRIKLGKPIVDSNRSFESIPWNGCTITINSSNYNEWPKLVDKHARLIRHSYGQTNSLGASSFTKQATSLSFKNLTNLDSNGKIKPNRTKSYLNLHLEKLNSQQKNLKKLKTKADNDSEIDDIDEADDSDDEYSDDFDDIENNVNHNKSKSNLFARTAPPVVPSLNFTRKLSESNTINNISLLGSKKNPLNASYYCTSGNIFQKKKKSLRV